MALRRLVGIQAMTRPSGRCRAGVGIAAELYPPPGKRARRPGRRPLLPCRHDDDHHPAGGIGRPGPHGGSIHRRARARLRRPPAGDLVPRGRPGRHRHRRQSRPRPGADRWRVAHRRPVGRAPRRRARGRVRRPRPRGSRHRGADVVIVCVPTPVNPSRDPDLVHVLAAARFVSEHLRARAARRPAVDDVPGHDDRAVPRGARGRQRPRRQRRFRPRVRPRAGQPGRPGERQPDGPARRRRRHAGGHGPDRDAVRPGQRHGRAGRLAGRRGDGEAAREHLPQRQHRPREPARPAVRADGHRRVGGHRRGVDQAVRVHAVHARAPGSAATASRSTRTTSPGGRASSGSSIASSSSPATST